MNNTFLIWLVGAAVVALGVLLLFGVPGGNDVGGPIVEPVGAVAETTPATVPVSSASYWEPAAPQPSRMGDVSVGCSACTPVYASLGTATVYSSSTSQPSTWVGGCGVPATACGPAPCAPLSRPCASGCSGCCETVCQERPRINRNMPLCVDECSFVQLHSTVAFPHCTGLRFEWAATKGRFLDPTASDPVYYAPTSYFPMGEDVWVTLTVTDSQGIRYSDQVQLHITNVR